MSSFVTFKDEVKGILENLLPRFNNIVATSFSYAKGPYVVINSIRVDSFDGACEFVDLPIIVGFTDLEKSFEFTLSVPTEEIDNIEFVCGAFYMRLLQEEEKQDVV